MFGLYLYLAYLVVFGTSLEYNREQREVTKNENVVINCQQLTEKFQRNEYNELKWKLPGGEVYDFDDNIYDKRISISSNGNELNIRKVELADDGLYECRVYLINGPSKAINIYLKVNEPPSWVDISRDVVREEGQGIHLRCKAKGTPEPRVSWRFIMPQVDEVRATGFNYLITKTTRNNGGRYVCTADNGVGNIIRHEVLLTINYAAEMISDEGTQGELRVQMGKRTSLQCKGRGQPTPNFQWVLPNGKIISKDKESSKDRFATVKRNGQQTTSTLHINKVSKQDFGEFQCIVYNDFGNETRTLYLREIPTESTRLPPKKYFPRNFCENHVFHFKIFFFLLHFIHLLFF